MQHILLIAMINACCSVFGVRCALYVVYTIHNLAAQKQKENDFFSDMSTKNQLRLYVFQYFSFGCCSIFILLKIIMATTIMFNETINYFELFRASAIISRKQLTQCPLLSIWIDWICWRVLRFMNELPGIGIWEPPWNRANDLIIFDVWTINGKLTRTKSMIK